MEATVIILFVSLLVILIFGGITLNSHITEEYDYGIFSIGNIFITCMASFMIFIAMYINDGATPMDINAVILYIVASCIYLLVFLLDLQKTTFPLAIVSIFFQIMVSLLIAIFIVIAVLYFFGSNSKKE